MTLMPAFHRHAQEAAIIGRLLIGYGELEYMLSVCLGRVLEDIERAQRTLFVIRGETNRLRIAEELTRYPYFQKQLGAEFTETMRAMELCRQIRNQFAHCHFDDDPTAGLFFTSLEKSTKDTELWDHEWSHIDVPLLTRQEAYFEYTIECLQYLASEYAFRNGKARENPFPMPIRLEPAARRNEPAKHLHKGR
jgi:hypothetical protein